MSELRNIRGQFWTDPSSAYNMAKELYAMLKKHF